MEAPLLPYCPSCKKHTEMMPVKLVKETEDFKEYIIDWSCPTCGTEMVRCVPKEDDEHQS